MKVKLMQTVYASNLKSRAILVMNYLIYRSNKECTCFPSIRTISKDCHLSINTVKRALDDLVKAGYVQKEARFIDEKNGAQTSNLYTLSTGMFVSEGINAETETMDNAVSASCQEEPIEYVTFNSIAVNESNYKSTGKCLSYSSNTVQGTALFITQLKIKNTKDGSYMQQRWAAPQPIVIPP